MKKKNYFKEILSKKAISLEELSQMKIEAYASMPYKFYMMIVELNKPTIIESPSKTETIKTAALNFIEKYENS